MKDEGCESGSLICPCTLLCSLVVRISDRIHVLHTPDWKLGFNSAQSSDIGEKFFCVAV